MRRSIPSLNWLGVFEAAARMENFARAAELLNMSTSAARNFRDWLLEQAA